MTKTKIAPSSTSGTNSSKNKKSSNLVHDILKFIEDMFKQHPLKVIGALAGLGFVFHSMFFAVASAIKLGVLVSYPDGSQKSGRAGSIVHQRNGVIRNFTAPRLVRNAATTLVRVSFGALSAAFRALSGAAQAAWNASPGLRVTNRLGRTIVITGKQLYVALNRALYTVGGTPLTLPPIFAGTSPPTSAAFNGSLAAGWAKITVTPTPIPAGSSWQFLATAPQGTGISRPPQSAFRLVTTFPAATATPLDGTAKYAIKFGSAPAIGQKVFGQLIATNFTTGEQSAPMQFSVIVAA